MAQVKKRGGRTQQFIQSKIEAGIRKAGATAEQAAQVTKGVTKKLAGKINVAASTLSDWVVAELRKVNKKAATEFAKYRDKKLKTEETQQ